MELLRAVKAVGEAGNVVEGAGEGVRSACVDTALCWCTKGLAGEKTWIAALTEKGRPRLRWSGGGGDA